MSKQFKVVFYLRCGYKTKDGKVAVLVRLYLNNERMTLGSAGVNVNPSQWDSKTGRVKGRKSDSANANAVLERIEADLNYLYRRHEFDDDLSLELIKSEYLGDSKSSQSFMEFFKQIVDKLHKEVGIERSYDSYQKHNRVYNHFLNFLQKRMHRNDIPMKSLNFRVVSDFADYMQNEGDAHITPP